MSIARFSRPLLAAVLFFVALAGASGAAAAPRCVSDCRPRIGIVSAFGAEADLLLAQTAARRTWRINGNRFTTGVLRGNPVVIVLSGVGMVNAAMTTQLLLDHFNIRNLLLSGISGGVNPHRHVGDVLAPARWAMPLEVYWNGDGSVPAACGEAGAIECLGLKLARGADGQPLPEFRLGATSTGQFMRENFVLNRTNAPAGEFRFDFAADAQMLAVAASLRPALAQCGPREPAQCVATQPALFVGGLGVSGNVFLANPAYRDYLYETIAAEAMDMETAALAQVAYANQVPFLAFRSLSDLAGGKDFKDVGAFFGSGLAETNAARVTLAFLEAWKQQRPASVRSAAR